MHRTPRIRYKQGLQFSLRDLFIYAVCVISTENFEADSDSEDEIEVDVVEFSDHE